MKLKGKDMMRRLHRLQQDGDAFNVLVKESKIIDNGGVSIRLNKDEQKTIEEAIQGVDELKTKVKRQMARARVVDFSKIDRVAAPAPGKNESYNYLMVEARQKLNTAMDVLFAKDSRLRKVAAPLD